MQARDSSQRVGRGRGTLKVPFLLSDCEGIVSKKQCLAKTYRIPHNNSCKQGTNRKDLQMFETMNPNSPYFSDYIDELEAYYPDEPMEFDFEDEDE